MELSGELCCDVANGWDDGLGTVAALAEFLSEPLQAILRQVQQHSRAGVAHPGVSCAVEDGVRPDPLALHSRQNVRYAEVEQVFSWQAAQVWLKQRRAGLEQQICAILVHRAEQLQGSCGGHPTQLDRTHRLLTGPLRDNVGHRTQQAANSRARDGTREVPKAAEKEKQLIYRQLHCASLHMSEKQGDALHVIALALFESPAHDGVRSHDIHQGSDRRRAERTTAFAQQCSDQLRELKVAEQSLPEVVTSGQRPEELPDRLSVERCQRSVSGYRIAQCVQLRVVHALHPKLCKRPDRHRELVGLGGWAGRKQTIHELAQQRILSELLVSRITQRLQREKHVGQFGSRRANDCRSQVSEQEVKRLVVDHGAAGCLVLARAELRVLRELRKATEGGENHSFVGCAASTSSTCGRHRFEHAIGGCSRLHGLYIGSRSVATGPLVRPGPACRPGRWPDAEAI